MKKTAWLFVLTFLLAQMLSVPFIRAQEPTSSITGSVLDTSGASIPGAAVTVRDMETEHRQMVMTDESGNYSVRAIPASRYELPLKREDSNPS